jgi:hypothetical protein
MLFYESDEFCTNTPESSFPGNTIEFTLTDYELADYKWMRDEIRDLMYKELLNEEIDADSIEFEFYQKTINASETSFLLDGLDNFAYYYVSLRACFAGANENEVECSEPTIILSQTEENPTSDRIETLCLDSIEPNTIEVSWDDPKHPNGAITNYYILYTAVDTETDVKKICVSYAEIKRNKKKVIRNVASGKYSVSVKVQSVANLGPKSSPLTVTVKGKSNKFMYFMISSIGLILVALIYFLVRAKRKIEIIKSMPNPFYSSLNDGQNTSYDTYESFELDDSYELEREGIELGKELGAGYFGIVYEGTLKNFGESKNDLTVAVKTVSCTTHSAAFSQF